MPPAIAVVLVTLFVLASTAYAWTPSQCPQDCVRPLSFWTQNRPGAGGRWPDSSATKSFPCGPTWLEVITSTLTDPWTNLAKQYIAAQLNILSFSCIDTLPSSITQALNQAYWLLSDDNCTVSDWALAVRLTAIIADFNNGNDGVATCLCPVCANGGSNPGTQCPTCSVCTTHPPFSCTPWVIDQCCFINETTTPPPTTRIKPTCGPCTRTQGYFKTHPIWEDFSVCGYSARELLKSDSRGGDAFIILARQYIAIRLNIEFLRVCLEEDIIVSGAIAYAEALLKIGGECCKQYRNYTVPAKGSPLRDKFISTATILDNCNNGLLGPGHCKDGEEEEDGDGRIAEVYADALETSHEVDDAIFSSAVAVVPATLCVIFALLASLQ